MCKKVQLQSGTTKFKKMKNQKTIILLNKLVELHNDRINGYETSAIVADDPDLKSLFAQLAHIRTKCRQELAFEIRRLGGIPQEVITISDRFFRAWMDVNDVLTGKDRKYFLESCEYNEAEALNTYKEVLEDDEGYLSLEIKSMIHLQHVLIKTGYDQVRSLSTARIMNEGNAMSGVNFHIEGNEGFGTQSDAHL